jgi:hypothetical protein
LRHNLNSQQVQSGLLVGVDGDLQLLHFQRDKTNGLKKSLGKWKIAYKDLLIHQ